MTFLRDTIQPTPSHFPSATCRLKANSFLGLTDLPVMWLLLGSAASLFPPCVPSCIPHSTCETFLASCFRDLVFHLPEMPILPLLVLVISPHLSDSDELSFPFRSLACHSSTNSGLGTSRTHTISNQILVLPHSLLRCTVNCPNMGPASGSLSYPHTLTPECFLEHNGPLFL